MIEDNEKGVFFAFVRQFPGICAQGNTPKEAHDKVNAYFKAYIDKIKDKEVSWFDYFFVLLRLIKNGLPIDLFCLTTAGL